MDIEYFDKEKIIEELNEKLKDKKVVACLLEKGFTMEEVVDSFSNLISIANHWYKKGYRDGQTAAHQNGGDID